MTCEQHQSIQKVWIFFPFLFVKDFFLFMQVLCGPFFFLFFKLMKIIKKNIHETYATYHSLFLLFVPHLIYCCLLLLLLGFYFFIFFKNQGYFGLTTFYTSKFKVVFIMGYEIQFSHIAARVLKLINLNFLFL